MVCVHVTVRRWKEGASWTLMTLSLMLAVRQKHENARQLIRAPETRLLNAVLHYKNHSPDYHDVERYTHLKLSS